MSQEHEIVLDVRKLNTSFLAEGKAVKIVKDVSLQLKRGTTMALVGESGCGKSVSVHSIVRLMPKNARVTAEKIEYNALHEGRAQSYRLDQLAPYGKEMRALRGAEIGMVFQDPMSSLNPVYRVGAQVAEGLMQHEKLNKKEAMARVLRMFKGLGIPDAESRINDYPYQFSGGMKQRVVIANAMICDPEIIIADEPTTALDVTIQAQIMTLMKDLQLHAKKSIILITHNMGLVAEMADEVCVMYMGRIVESGSLEAVFEQPSHPYTAALLRSVPVLGMAEGEVLATIPGATPNPADFVEGCEFAERCSESMPRCFKGTIPNFERAAGHRVRCLKYESFPEVD